MFEKLFGRKKEEPKIIMPEELKKFIKPKQQEKTETQIKFREQTEEDEKLAEERRQSAIEKLREKIKKPN